MRAGVEATQNSPYPSSPLVQPLVSDTAPGTHGVTSKEAAVENGSHVASPLGSGPRSVDGGPTWDNDTLVNRASVKAQSNTLDMYLATNHHTGHAEMDPKMDVTVMAYAQWLSDMKHQAASARFQQKAELDLMRDAIAVSSSELGEFKRYLGGAVQQLQSQVSELRRRMADVAAETSTQTRQRLEAESHHKSVISGLQEALQTRSTDLDTGRRTLAETVEQLRQEVMQMTVATRTAETEIASVRKALASSQEQTIMKFGEVDQALNIFRNGFTTLRTEVGDTKQDWKKGQDLLGQAISTLSQDFADFQKHTSTVTRKLQSDVTHVEESGRQVRERNNRTEAQLAGLQQSVYDTANEMILMKSERSDEEGKSDGGVPIGGSLQQARGSSSSIAAAEVRLNGGSRSASAASPPGDGGDAFMMGVGSNVGGAGQDDSAASAGSGSQQPRQNWRRDPYSAESTDNKLRMNTVPSGPQLRSEVSAAGDSQRASGSGRSPMRRETVTSEAFARPPQQDPRRSAQRRTSASTTPVYFEAGPTIGPSMAMSSPAVRGQYNLSRTPSPGHRSPVFMQ